MSNLLLFEQKGLHPIPKNEAISFLVPRHYSGREPVISWAFGWFVQSELVAVCTFGKPSNRQLCSGVCGSKFSKYVYELNRLCRIENVSIQLSVFVSACLRELKKHNLIIVSYADTAMNHNGYMYQACNFLYTGATKERTDPFGEGKHARHIKPENMPRQIRSAKHRYIYFCAKNKKSKKEMLKALNYKVKPYPKGENKNYILGQFIEAQLV